MDFASEIPDKTNQDKQRLKEAVDSGRGCNLFLSQAAVSKLSTNSTKDEAEGHILK